MGQEKPSADLRTGPRVSWMLWSLSHRSIVSVEGSFLELMLPGKHADGGWVNRTQQLCLADRESTNLQKMKPLHNGTCLEISRIGPLPRSVQGGNTPVEMYSGHSADQKY